MKDINLTLENQPLYTNICNTHEIKEVAVRYNGNQLTNNAYTLPFSVSLDWLTINIFSRAETGLNTEPLQGIFEFEVQQYQTKHFTKVTKVYFENDEIGTLTHEPHEGSVLKVGFCQLQFENSFLYIPKEKMFKVVTALLEHLNADFQSINRMDIAIDFPKDSKLFFRPDFIAEELISHKLLIAGRKKNIAFYTETENGKVQNNGFAVGKRNQARFFRCYNKSKEMEKKPKPWIQSLHEQMNATNDIWRAEIQLSSRFFNMFPEFGYKSIFQFMDYVRLFQFGVKNFVDVRINENKERLTNNQPLDLFKWSEIEKLSPSFNQVDFTKKPRNIEHNQREAAKRTLKANFKEYYKEQSEITPLVAAVYLIEKYDLEEFFTRKTDEWLMEFHRISKIFNPDFDFPAFVTDFSYIKN